MKTGESRNRIVGGIALIILGLIALAAQFIDIGETAGLLIVPVLGIIFLLWGLLTRQSGLLIPGGILSGIGLGILLITGPYELANEEIQGGAFMLAFATGWFLIPILATIFTGDSHWWALIPGGIMALIGGGLLFGGAALTVLEYAGKLWPVVLILGGIYLILRRSTTGKSA